MREVDLLKGSRQRAEGDRGGARKGAAMYGFAMRVLFVVLLAAGPAAASEGFYAGIHGSYTSFSVNSSDPLDKNYFNSLSSGPGLDLRIGWALTENFAIEGSLLRSYHDSDFLGMTELERQVFSGRTLDLRLSIPVPETRYTPSAFLGYGQYAVGDSGGTHYRGSGAELGLGLAVRMISDTAVSGSVIWREITFDSGSFHLDQDTDVTTLSFEIGIVLHFK